MMRTTFALASAIAVMAAFAPSAEACISCSYTPEVLKAGSGSGATYSAKPSKRVREYSEERERRASKKRVAKEESAPRERKETAKKSEPKFETSTKTASVEPEMSDAQVEHSGITTTGASIANQVKAAITPASTGPETENSTISTAVAKHADTPVESTPIEHVAADKNIGCKKYFPSTGLTLSVPCE
jgi:hypothetical protein